MEKRHLQIRDEQRLNWDRFSPGWEKWDTLIMNLNTPINQVMIERLQISEYDHILDIAAGSGEPGLTIAELAKKGKVTGADLSEKMLQIAQSKARKKGLRNYDILVADASELPFADNSFDKISCRMGFMFFPDMQLASDEMHRVLKPGGRIVASVWAAAEQNFWATGMMDVIKKHVDVPVQSPGAPGLFRCARPGFMAEIFSRSGFINIADQGVQGEADFVDADTYWQSMLDVSAPVMSVMQSVDDATREAIKQDAYKLISEHGTDNHPWLEFGAIVVHGRK